MPALSAAVSEHSLFGQPVDASLVCLQRRHLDSRRRFPSLSNNARL